MRASFARCVSSCSTTLRSSAFWSSSAALSMISSTGGKTRSSAAKTMPSKLSMRRARSLRFSQNVRRRSNSGLFNIVRAPRGGLAFLGPGGIAGTRELGLELVVQHFGAAAGRGLAALDLLEAAVRLELRDDHVALLDR